MKSENSKVIRIGRRERPSFGGDKIKNANTIGAASDIWMRPRSVITDEVTEPVIEELPK